MAKKNIDLEAVETIRKTWISKFDTVIQSSLKALKEQAFDMEGKAKKAVLDFNNGENVSYKVGARILAYIQAGEQRTALITTHKAINECQNISSFFRLVIYPAILDIHNDAIFVYNRTLNTFKADADVAFNYNSNAEIEREASFVCIMAEQYVDSITLCKDKIDQYLKFVDEQMYSLSRLDVMLRTNEKMLFSEVYSRGSSDYIMNNPLEESELDQNEDYEQTSYEPDEADYGLYVAIIGDRKIASCENKKTLKRDLKPEHLNAGVSIWYVEDDGELTLISAYDNQDCLWRKG